MRKQKLFIHTRGSMGFEGWLHQDGRSWCLITGIREDIVDFAVKYDLEMLWVA